MPVELGPLLAVFERARHLGFLGPGPVVEHVDHAAGFLAALAQVEGRVIDLGSGGGVPGLVIALARPDLEVVLVDATAKRCHFLEDAVDQLGLAVTVVEDRAEVVGHGSYRGTAAAVTARSFGAPAVTAECGAPLLQVNGVLIVSEPPVRAGDRWSQTDLGRLGLELGPAPTTSPAVQVLRLVAPCPAMYPRRVGVPGKRPLF